MITKAQLQSVQRALDAALPAIGKRLGLSLSTGRGTYGAEGTLKIVVNQLDSDGNAIKPEPELWNTMAPSYHLRPGDLNAMFTVNGSVYRIDGLKPSRRKYPINATRVSDGKQYKFGVVSVLRALKRDIPEYLYAMES